MLRPQKFYSKTTRSQLATSRKYTAIFGAKILWVISIIAVSAVNARCANWGRFWEIPQNAANAGSGAGASGGGTSQTNLRLFVTATSYNGMRTNIAAIDGLCQVDANKPNSGTYKAVVADAGSSREACSATANCTTYEGINWVLYANRTYVRADGVTVIGTTNAAARFVFPLSASITGVAAHYWTGILNNWTGSSSHCGSWNSTGLNGQRGIGDSVTNTAIDIGGSQACNLLNPFLCAEQ